MAGSLLFRRSEVDHREGEGERLGQVDQQNFADFGLWGSIDVVEVDLVGLYAVPAQADSFLSADLGEESESGGETISCELYEETLG